MRFGLTRSLDEALDQSLGELERRLDASADAPVAVAFSGGGDSRALLRLVAIWARPHGRPVLALTVDHALHPDSAAWTAAAGEVARAEGARFRALKWDGPKPAAGLPCAARDARHALLACAARAAGARVLVFGHTADDRAEADHMRLDAARGIGRLRAWSPSPAWPQGRGVFLLRPLLNVARADLRAWLVDQGCAGWLEDPANADLRFARPRARLLVSGGKPPRASPDPALDGPPPDPADAAFGRLVWRRADLASLDETVLRLWLSCAVVCAGGRARPPGAASLERPIAAVRRADRDVFTLARARVEVDASTVAVVREANERRGGDGDPALAPGREAIWDGRWSVTAQNPGWRVGFAGGHLARLPPSVRARIKPLEPAVRRALPALFDAQGGVYALAPFGDAPARASCLVADRFAQATGAVVREADLDPQNQSRALNQTSGRTAESTIRARA